MHVQYWKVIEWILFFQNLFMQSQILCFAFVSSRLFSLLMSLDFSCLFHRTSFFDKLQQQEHRSKSYSRFFVPPRGMSHFPIEVVFYGKYFVL